MHIFQLKEKMTPKNRKNAHGDSLPSDPRAQEPSTLLSAWNFPEEF
jgi:hypothetical protein